MFSLGSDPPQQRTKRPRRTTISNAYEPMSELNRQAARGTGKGLYTNLYNLNYDQMQRLGLPSTINTTSTKQRDGNTSSHDIRKSKSSPALISQAVREMPVQPQVSESQNSLTALLKQLKQDNIQEDILSTLPSPCFKLVNSPPSPKFLTGESTPPPSFFQAASPASWKNVMEYQHRRLRSTPDDGGGIYRTCSAGSNDKENLMKARRAKLQSRSDVNLAGRKSESPEENANNTRFFQERNAFYGSPTDISLELNKDLALDPIPSHSPTEYFEDSFLTDGHSLEHEEIDFLVNLSETLLKLTSDTNLASQVTDLIGDMKSKQPKVIPSNDAFRFAKLLLTSEAMRVTSYALKFSKTHQKKGTIKPTEMLKKGNISSFFKIC